MRRRAVATAIAAAPLAVTAACGTVELESLELLARHIAGLETEREALRRRLNELKYDYPRLVGMPETPVRIGVPTSLARGLVQRVLTGFVDPVTLELNNLRVRKRGTGRRVITLGDYDLRVTVNRVTGTLRTGPPEVTFGGNVVAFALLHTVAAAHGHATIDFTWDGRNVAGAVCCDMTVRQTVTGAVRPRTYPIASRLVLPAASTPPTRRGRPHRRVSTTSAACAALCSMCSGSSGASSTGASTCACPPRT